MPESVKKLLADLIEMYGIYGEVMCLFRQTEVHPICILHFDALYGNRILEPLDEAENLRARLPAHFEQIKYECQQFNIRFQAEIYTNTANLRDAANLAFKGGSKLDILKAIPQTSKVVGKELNRMHNSLITYAAFFGDHSRDSYSHTLNVLHQELIKPLNKALPAMAMQLVAKFLPENAEWDLKDVLKFMNNSAVIAIFLQLIKFEPWKTLTNPDALQKILTNFEGIHDNRMQDIFASPIAMNALESLRMTPESEAKLIYGNKSFLKLNYWLYTRSVGKPSILFLRTLVKINNGEMSFNGLIPTTKTQA